MIQITTQPNDKTTDPQYKINTSFNSLQTYIDNAEFVECCSNADIITSTDSLVDKCYKNTYIYGYYYGDCRIIGQLNDGMFTCNCCQVINVRVTGRSSTGEDPNTCITSAFTYEYNKGAPWRPYFYSQLCGGKCPVPFADFQIRDRFLWACLCNWANEMALCCNVNPVQLNQNTWLYVLCSKICIPLAGLPIVPVGTTLLVPPSEVPPSLGSPIYWCKDGKTIIDAYCPQFVCVYSQSGGMMTLLDFNIRGCGSNPNNYIEVSLPDIINTSTVDAICRWNDEHIQYGYCNVTPVPAEWIYDSYYDQWYWAYYQPQYCYDVTNCKYITLGCSQYKADINQILFKKGSKNETSRSK